MAAAAGKTGTGAGSKAPAARFRDSVAAARENTPGEPEQDRAALRERLTGADTPLENRRARGPGEDLTPPAEREAAEGLAPRTQAQIASEMDPQEWACRSQEHSWPQLVPGATEVPRGMRFSAAGSGNVRQTDDCLHDCGRYRETVLANGFVVVSRTYGTRPGYRHTVVHRDESMTKAGMREHTLGSNAKLIRRAVKEATAETRAAARETKAQDKAAAS